MKLGGNPLFFLIVGGRGVRPREAAVCALIFNIDGDSACGVMSPVGECLVDKVMLRFTATQSPNQIPSPGPPAAPGGLYP